MLMDFAMLVACTLRFGFRVFNCRQHHLRFLRFVLFSFFAFVFFFMSIRFARHLLMITIKKFKKQKTWTMEAKGNVVAQQMLSVFIGLWCWFSTTEFAIVDAKKEFCVWRKLFADKSQHSHRFQSPAHILRTRMQSSHFNFFEVKQKASKATNEN